MRPILLIDFGSTYTKLTAVDLDAESLLGTAAAHTTVQTDINEGLREAMGKLEQKTGKLTYEKCYACSSAAGGLRMVTSGLVPELTAEAAKLASLGAGAKVVGVYAYQLTEEDVDDIFAAKPDIFLLVGGTDGGNTECIVHNAKMLAACKPQFPIVIAGNRNAARKCQELLQDCQTHICPNVMPKFGQLQIEPAQAKIREIFLDRIISAKGLSKAAQLLSDIMMPTPSAVLQAMELLAKGCEGEPGIGDLICVDVGGATTDVYSMTDGTPDHAQTVCKGLPEPFAKRTVEGDIGMRYSVSGILDAAGIRQLSQLSGLAPERISQLTEFLQENPDATPEAGDDLQKLDHALAACAVREAVKRHAGTIRETYTMMGLTYVQEGKNLSRVNKIVVTGGSLIHSARTTEIAAHALASAAEPESLRPRQADVLVDRAYILAAMGLLASHYPQTALRIMKKELEFYGHSE